MIYDPFDPPVDNPPVDPTSDNTPVNPVHYNKFNIEPIDFIAQNGLDFLTGNAIKYLMRHRDKNGIEDLEKAEQYIKFIKKYEYGVS